MKVPRVSHSEKVIAFLDRAMIKCQTQAEINKEAHGLPVFTEVDRSPDGKVCFTKTIDNPLEKSH
jgi:hypothetical protein